MLVLKERLLNVPVMSLQTGAEVARTDRPIIDPRQLTIAAFYCVGAQLGQRTVLHTEDIREFSSLGYIINHQDNLMAPDDLVRLKQVIGFNFTLDDKQVADDTGRKIGKVINYTVDTNSFYITQLHVQPSFLQSFGTAEVMIGRQQIIEITDKKIVVASATIRSSASAGTAVDNPFRRRHTQPEVSHTARGNS